eukprot:TRINITY_DN3005_c0_g2_i16.p1 TRINITY_DN3005_c0_g2~~TRINITY_DN3005_c0_g2_i16.p1  ORF type:complete len:247 (-),score=23.52 TRINITY_DN3005_c0_g2_i16:112-852(-)
MKSDKIRLDPGTPSDAPPFGDRVDSAALPVIFGGDQRDEIENILKQVPEEMKFKEIFKEMFSGFSSLSFIFLPGSFLLGGIFYTNLLLIAAGWMSTLCMFNLIDLREDLGSSIREMSYNVWGRKSVYFIDSFLFLSMYADVFAYVSAVAVVLDGICSYFSLQVDWYILAAIQFVYFFTLTSHKKARESRLGAAISEIFFIFGLLVIVYYSVDSIFARGMGDDVQIFQHDSLLGALGEDAKVFTLTS